MNRPIVAFRLDEDAHWVAELSCGHSQHTRHDPPFSARPWVLTPEGRQSRVGTPLDCVLCDRREFPEGFEPYQRTPTFTEATIPDALLRKHATKRGVWALLHVCHGRLEVHLHAPFETQEVVTPDDAGVIVAEVEHHVAAAGPVEFFVEFWRSPRRA